MAMIWDFFMGSKPTPEPIPDPTSGLESFDKNIQHITDLLEPGKQYLFKSTYYGNKLIVLELPDYAELTPLKPESADSDITINPEMVDDYMLMIKDIFENDDADLLWNDLPSGR